MVLHLMIMLCTLERYPRAVGGGGGGGGLFKIQRMYLETPNPNRKLQIPNPKPQTPNPKFQTPNPKLQTPNPKPQTPNPKPQTPNPTLLDGGAGVWIDLSEHPAQMRELGLNVCVPMCVRVHDLGGAGVCWPYCLVHCRCSCGLVRWGALRGF